MHWTELRPVQVQSINAIFNTSSHIIISANTASGKTEAAFLPIISKVVDNAKNNVRALYVGPLKALINDQFVRMEKLCDLADIPVTRWHGDVSASLKKKFLKTPQGILLITPESIESLFINHSHEIPSIFGNLDFIVIDEMHSFIGTERGAHLLSHLYRISQKNKNGVRFVGLSATLGDPDLSKRWLSPQNPENVRVISDESGDRGISFLIKAYEEKEKNKNQKSQEQLEKETDSVDYLISTDILKYFSGKKGLIFANSRADIENYTDLARQKLEFNPQRERIRIHHGSLSKTEREDTESALKSEKQTVAFCTNTLELGIDIGNVALVGQINPPHSVNSLVQRLGRSGRGVGESSSMVMFVVEKSRQESNIVNRIHPNLLLSIALTELMKEHWCEPPNVDIPHYSTLVQQILSVIAERGSVLASEAFEILIAKGGFFGTSKKDFLSVLHCLGEQDLIDQDDQSGLILGLWGEKIVRHYDFYSVFQTQKEFDVIHDGHKIGSIQYIPEDNAIKSFILAGKRWEITSIDVDRQEIYVKPSRGAKSPKFLGGGINDIHVKVRQKMREVLLSEDIPTYIDMAGKKLLEDARKAALNAKLDQADFVVEGTKTIWFTWASSALQCTLLILGEFYEHLEIEDLGIALRIKNKSPEEIKQIFGKYLRKMPEKEELEQYVSKLPREKYDRFIPPDLIAKRNAAVDIDTDLTQLEFFSRLKMEMGM